MTVVFENKNLIVINKAIGENCEDGGEGTVPFLIRKHLGSPEAYVATVHRLDTATSGLMVYALTKKAAAILSEQASGDGMKKEYLLVCTGIPDPPGGTMEDFLFKDSRKNKVFPVKSERKGAKHASLSYETLSTITHPEHGEVSLCRALLHTGRTHQIRVQFASRRHPLLGDGKYGSRVKGHMALFCHRLSFTFPGEQEPRSFELDTEEGFFGLFAGTQHPLT